MPQANFTLPDDLMKALKDEAIRQNRTFSNLCQTALKAYLETLKK
jgi:hypothetical protein